MRRWEYLAQRLGWQRALRGRRSHQDQWRHVPWERASAQSSHGRIPVARLSDEWNRARRCHSGAGCRRGRRWLYDGPAQRNLRADPLFLQRLHQRLGFLWRCLYLQRGAVCRKLRWEPLCVWTLTSQTQRQPDASDIDHSVTNR